MRRALAAGSALEYAASDDAIIIGCWNTRTSKWTVLNALFITEKAKSPTNWAGLFLISGSPTWARTRDLRINSPALYQLSYRGTEAIL